MKKLLLILLLTGFASTGKSQDSLAHLLQQLVVEDSLVRNEMRFSRDGISMPIRGIIQTFTHRKFNRMPGPYRENNHRWEDYSLALSPLAATWAMKVFGVKSRSTTQRMLTANAMAAGLTIGLTQTLKWSVNAERPDGSNNNSLPSMHASLAYMGATILSREYGHISPWISIGGYAAATGTQMLRIGHNAHWMNDIFMGAGIGVVSTNLAYYITDRIIGRKGINSFLDANGNWEIPIQPQLEEGSGIRLISGTETSGRNLNVADFALAEEGFDMTDVKIRSSASITTGIEAEWFITDQCYLSAIARYTMSQTKLDIPDYSTTAWGEHIHTYHGNIATGWVYPVMKNIHVGIRTQWGVRYNEGVTFHRVAENQQVGEPLLHIKPQLRPVGGTGIVIDMLQNNNQTIGLNIDFLHTFNTRFLPNRWVISSTWKAQF